jgi:hypothetical protein
LTGYASGFASACFEREIYFQEISCSAQGTKVCSVVGKDAASWGGVSTVTFWRKMKEYRLAT